MGEGVALEFDLAPVGLALLDLDLLGFAPGDVPELLGGLEHGERRAVELRACLRRGQTRQTLREPLEPDIEHGAHGVGRAAAQVLAHALDRGLLALGHDLVGRCEHVFELNATRAGPTREAVRRTRRRR